MKKNLIKKVASLVMIMTMVLMMTGCHFSVGNPPASNDGYNDLFPDAAAEAGAVNKHSHMTYDFSLGDYGTMKVSVDTSDGHKFELQSENGGFNVVDKDGNPVVYAAAVNQEAYANFVSQLGDTVVINGREFSISRNGDGTIDVFSYMADCGLDCGFVMESTDEKAFRLVAFRGEPVESTLDMSAYASLDEDTLEDAYDDLEDEESDASEDTGSLVTSLLAPEVEEVLNSLDTDYGNVLWGVRYPVSEDVSSLVISVTPYTEYDTEYLLIGLTNLYDTPITFTGTAVALDADGNEIGETFIYETAIGPANTVVNGLRCSDGIPDGRIRWKDAQVKAADYNDYCPWELDYMVKGTASDGFYNVSYEIYPANDDTLSDFELTMLLLDENGFVLAVGTDFIDSEIAPGEKFGESISIYADEEVLKLGKSIACFANPIKSIE